MEPTNDFARVAGGAALAGGALGFAALVMALVVEATSDGMAMDSGLMPAAGWASFVAAGLLAVGLLGLAVRYAGTLSNAGRVAVLALGFSIAMTTGVMATLALIVPDLTARAPEIVDSPPAAVPATFIVSGIASGICALVLAIGLRRSGAAPKATTTLLIVGAVVSMLPLPSRFFLLAFAVGLLARAPEHSRSEPQPVGQIS